MKNTTLLKSLALGSFTLIALNSCAPGPNAQYGTSVGSLAGAAIGGVIGHQSGHALEGAAIGAAAGGLAGNQIGASHDNAYAAPRTYSPQPAYQPTYQPQPVIYEQQPVFVERNYYPTYYGHRPYYHRPHRYHGSSISFSTGYGHGCHW